MCFAQSFLQLIVFFPHGIEISIVEQFTVVLNSHLGSSDGILSPLVKHGQKDIVSSAEFRAGKLAVLPNFHDTSFLFGSQKPPSTWPFSAMLEDFFDHPV